MTQSLGVIIVDKTGTLKTLNIKDYKEDELYKKCGFKKMDGFNKQTEWSVKCDGNKYVITAYGKIYGKANCENKYDFPPPIDTKLFFGACCLVARIKNDDGDNLCNLSVELWEKIYEKLFGGFEDLVVTCNEDEEEEDELANVPAEKKTKQGYLKDGFVVDTDSTEECDESDLDDSSEDNDDDHDIIEEDDTAADDLLLEDIGSELSEESYEYESDAS